MEGCARAVERRLVVCARNNCWKCKPEQDVVPESCDFEILHPLETEKWSPGVQQYGRQTGKTTRLVEYANYMAKDGHRVYFLVMNHLAGQRLRLYRLNDRVLVVSKHEASRRLRSMPPGYALADEILPEELDEMAEAIQRNVLVAAWYTRH